MSCRPRFFWPALYLTLLIAVASPTYAAPPQQEGGLLTTTTTNVNLRAGPGVEWKWLAQLNAGTPFLLDGRAPSGTWARGITPAGQIGWVLSENLAAASDQIAALPAIWVETPFTLAPPPGGAPDAAPAPAQPAEATSPPAAASPALPSGGLTVTAANRVNVRAAASVDGGVLATLNPGAPVAVDGKDATQQWARGAVPGGMVGWVAIRHLVITADQVAQLPVVEGGASAAPAAPAPAEAAPAVAPAAETAAPVAAANTAPTRGFSYGGHVDGFGEYAVNQMRRAGMTWTKRQWRYYSGQNPGDAAGLIADAHAKGFRILLGIVGVPEEVNNPGYFEQFAAFVGGVAAQGADAIEVWNEMNIDREWPAGSIDPGRYTEMLRLAYNAIKAANPNTLVISGAPAPTGFFGGCSPNGCDDAPYIAGMARAGAARYADCIGLHYNEGIVGPTATSGDPRGSSGFYTRYFYGMLNTYSRAFGGAKPLCFTELGYLTGEGYPPLPGGFAWAQNVTVAQQAAWLDQAVSLSAQSGKVRLLIIWNVDFTQYGDDPMAGYAIIRPGGACPACEALSR